MSTSQPLARVYLLGYRGLRHEKFFGLLADAGVSVLLDVRSSPYSPNPDYQQANLAGAAEGYGVRYRHLPELGAPSMDPNSLLTSMDQQLATPEADKALKRIIRTLEAGIGVALMCAEPNYLDCHRVAIVEELQRRRPEIELQRLTAVGEQRLF